jgi:hypothetical protein
MSIGVNRSILLGHVDKNPRDPFYKRRDHRCVITHSPPATSKWTARETGRTARSGITL